MVDARNVLLSAQNKAEAAVAGQCGRIFTVRLRGGEVAVSTGYWEEQRVGTITAWSSYEGMGSKKLVIASTHIKIKSRRAEFQFR